jgi:hypothetical protein
VGGVTGMVAPELLTHPTTLMMGARAMDSPALQKLAIPGATGAVLGLTHVDDDDQPTTSENEVVVPADPDRGVGEVQLPVLKLPKK